MSLIGLDIGTSGCKATVFDEQGIILASASREYPILMPQPGWAEQDADLVWAQAQACLCQVAGVYALDPPAAMALSVQGEAIIAVDAQGRSLRHAILGMDTRTVAENAIIQERWGRQGIFERTGMPLHTINTLPKLLWLRDHEPTLWHKAHQFLLYEDYIVGRLSGQPVISHCLASRTQMYALQEGQWDDEILGVLGLDPRRLAPLAPQTIAPVATVAPAICDALRLPRDLPIVAGGHDQACAALGSGVIAPGCAMVSTGTAEVVELVLDQPILDQPIHDWLIRADGLAQGGISIYRHVVPGRLLAMTLNHAGGLVLRWFRDTLFAAEHVQAQADGAESYQRMLDDAPAGPTSLLFLPHMSGSGTPLLDTASKGAWVGLTFATTRAEMAKAVLEGLTFELRQNLELLQASGFGIEALHAVGGGARSDLWLQLKADICGIPLRVPRVTEAACLGAALLAGVGVGVFEDATQAVSQTVALDRQFVPDAASQQAYAVRAALYSRLYLALADLLHRL